MNVDSYKKSGWITAHKVLAIIFLALSIPVTILLASNYETDEAAPFVFIVLFSSGLNCAFAHWLLSCFADIRHYTRISAYALLKQNGLENIDFTLGDK